MVEQGKEQRPFLTKLSEEAQDALNIAGAVASCREVMNPYMKPLHYIEPLHLVLGLTKQSSVRHLLVRGSVDPDKMSDVLILHRPLFEADYKPQSGEDGHLSDRSKFAIAIASRLAERAGRLEISAIDMAHGIIIEDREYSDPTGFMQTHETKRMAGLTVGSLLESIIGIPYRRRIGTEGGDYGKRIVPPFLSEAAQIREAQRIRRSEGETEIKEKPDQPPEVSE